MATAASAADGRHAGIGEQPAQRPLGDRQTFAIREQLGEVGPVDSRVAVRGELHHTGPDELADPVGGHPTGIAMDQRGGTFCPQPREQPPDLANRQVQHSRCLLGAHLSVPDVPQHEQPVLDAGVHADRLPRVHVREGDKVAGR
jgi:hypothetical protein